MTTTDRQQEYRWYVLGCDRLDREPVSLCDFSELWQKYEDHAESLKLADKQGSLLTLDITERSKMEKQIQNDPMLKAVLIGQSEDQ